MPCKSSEEKRATQARWRQRNKHKIAEYKDKNRDAINTYGRMRHAKIMSDPVLAEKQKLRRKKYYEDNKERYNEVIRRWKQANPERVKFNDRNKHLRRNYGITEHEYQDMHAAQGGLCAICRSPEGAKNRRLAVDHCHKTGLVRKLLCGRCNGALGWLEKYKEDISTYLDTVW